jgi:hypothetical protein
MSAELIDDSVDAVSVAPSPDQPSSRATVLVERLRQVAEALIGLVGAIESERWMNVPGPGVWSAGKEAEHVADGAAYHQWIVRCSLGQQVPPRPRIERAQLTPQRSQRDVVELLVQRTNDSVALIAGLSDEQLDLPARPPRARSPTLAQMIASVLIGHYEVHHRDIEAKTTRCT